MTQKQKNAESTQNEMETNINGDIINDLRQSVVGLRSSDLIKIKWNDINFHDHTITTAQLYDS